MSIDQLAQDLGSMYSVDQIRGAVEVLINDGHVYSTIDDNHFKSTSC